MRPTRTLREVLWMLAVAHGELGNFEQGLPYAEAFVEAVPANVGGHLMLASYCEALGEEGKALEQYREALLIERENPRALHGLAMIEMRCGEDALAIASLEPIVELYPSDPCALVPPSVLYLRQERFKDALQVLTRAARRAPDSRDAQHYLGALYSNLGRYELAAQHLERALKLQPDDPATLFETGLVHARQEELSAARGFFERALEGRPDNAETHFRLAEIHHYESEVDEAERYYLEAIELDSGYAAAYFHLGRLYAGASRARESEAPLLRALELDAGLSEAHHELARVYDQLDQLDKAQAHFESALELAPFAPAPQLNFANFLLRRSAPEKGRAQLLEFRKLKEAENRIKELKAAINFDPTNASYKRELVE